jgi:hypothetical protein
MIRPLYLGRKCLLGTGIWDNTNNSHLGARQQEASPKSKPSITVVNTLSLTTGLFCRGQSQPE